jgi:hypothetical protein
MEKERERGREGEEPGNCVDAAEMEKLKVWRQSSFRFSFSFSFEHCGDGKPERMVGKDRWLSDRRRARNQKPIGS